MARPIKPGQQPAQKSQQEVAASAAELDRYRTEILSANAGELDKADQAELGRMIAEGIRQMRANGEVR
jgi:hypothetical protein